MASAAVPPENLWGKLKEPSKVNLPAAEGEEQLTKASIRTCLWEFLERSDIANYPRNEWLESKCCSLFEIEIMTSLECTYLMSDDNVNVTDSFSQH